MSRSVWFQKYLFNLWLYRFLCAVQLMLPIYLFDQRRLRPWRPSTRALLGDKAKKEPGPDIWHPHQHILRGYVVLCKCVTCHVFFTKKNIEKWNCKKMNEGSHRHLRHHCRYVTYLISFSTKLWEYNILHYLPKQSPMFRCILFTRCIAIY